MFFLGVFLCECGGLYGRFLEGEIRDSGMGWGGWVGGGSKPGWSKKWTQFPKPESHFSIMKKLCVCVH